MCGKARPLPRKKLIAMPTVMSKYNVKHDEHKAEGVIDVQTKMETKKMMRKISPPLRSASLFLLPPVAGAVVAGAGVVAGVCVVVGGNVGIGSGVSRTNSKSSWPKLYPSL